MATILVVEDDMVARRILGHTLGRAGYEILMAEDGHIALEQLGTTTVNLMVCDVNLPGMSGIQLLERLREQPKYAKLPVVMLTASQEIEDRQRAISLEVSAFLTKPTSSSDLLQILERLLH